MGIETVGWIILGCLAVVLEFVVLGLAWPFLLCWHFGHPIIWIFAELVWIMVLESS